MDSDRSESSSGSVGKTYHGGDPNGILRQPSLTGAGESVPHSSHAAEHSESAGLTHAVGNAFTYANFLPKTPRTVERRAKSGYYGEWRNMW